MGGGGGWVGSVPRREICKGNLLFSHFVVCLFTCVSISNPSVWT